MLAAGESAAGCAVGPPFGAAEAVRGPFSFEGVEGSGRLLAQGANGRQLRIRPYHDAWMG